MLVLAAAAVLERPALADETSEPLRVEITGDTGCVDGAGFFAAIHARTAKVREAALPPAPRSPRERAPPRGRCARTRRVGEAPRPRRRPRAPSGLRRAAPPRDSPRKGGYLETIPQSPGILTAIWGSGGTDIYAVGENGAIVHRTGH